MIFMGMGQRRSILAIKSHFYQSFLIPYLCITTNPNYRGKQLPRKVRTAEGNPPVNSRRSRKRAEKVPQKITTSQEEKVKT